jgi:glycosyltransferase involved in cell wall biosynthesis
MFEFVVPAHNEGQYVGNVVRWARSAFGQAMKVIVVDNASADGTAEVAIAAGADEIVTEPRLGKGFAVLSGLRRCQSRYVMLCDADITGLSPDVLLSLRELVMKSDSPLGRLSLGRAPEDAPVTTMLALPLLSALGLDGRAGSEPLGGLMMAECGFLFAQHLPGGWGFDIACTLATVRSGKPLPELPVRGVAHRHKPLIDYVGMAREVCLAVLRATGNVPWDHADCTYCSAAPVLSVQPAASGAQATRTERLSEDSGPVPC